MKNDNTKLPDIDFTVNLFKFLDFVIGNNDSISFPKQFLDLIEIVEVKLQKSGTLLYKIQHPSELYPHILSPVLWKYSAWMSDSERLRLQKEQSDLERRQKFAFDENVKMVAKCYRMTTDCDVDFAYQVAYQLVKKQKWQQIKGLGVTTIKKAEDYKQ